MLNNSILIVRINLFSGAEYSYICNYDTVDSKKRVINGSNDSETL